MINIGKFLVILALSATFSPVLALMTDDKPVQTIVVIAGKADFKGVDGIIQSKDERALAEASKSAKCRMVASKEAVFIFHEPSLGIESLVNRLNALSDLTKKNVAPMSVLEEMGLSEDTYESLVESICRMPRFEDLYSRGKVKTYLCPGYQFFFNKDGKRTTFMMKADSSDDSSTLKLMNDPPDMTRQKSRPLPDKSKSLEYRSASLDRIAVMFNDQKATVAAKVKLSAQAFTILEDTLEKLGKDVTELRKSLLQKLLAGFENQYGTPVPDGAKGLSFNDLPIALKQTIEGSFMADWKRNGFASENEALSYLRSCDIELVTQELFINMEYRTDGGAKVRNSSQLDIKSRLY